MTTIDDITLALELLLDEWPLASLWIGNDIIKKSLAVTYDDWVKEMERIGEEEPLLEDHIIYYLDTRDKYFHKLKEPTE